MKKNYRQQGGTTLRALGMLTFVAAFLLWRGCVESRKIEQDFGRAFGSLPKFDLHAPQTEAEALRQLNQFLKYEGLMEAREIEALAELERLVRAPAGQGGVTPEQFHDVTQEVAYRVSSRAVEQQAARSGNTFTQGDEGRDEQAAVTAVLRAKAAARREAGPRWDTMSDFEKWAWIKARYRGPAHVYLEGLITPD